jgi:DNA helicase-2/ATP-dependent DNA helicase PcrA
VNDPADLLKDLTEPQRQAVIQPGGPLLIVAGAGSGKTRVITRRVAYLISQGALPSSILAITFTNKAAGEMKQRVADVLERPPRDWGRLEQPSPMICTFHSLCLRILKHYAPVLGIPANFSVFDSADQTKLIKQALEELGISSTHYPPASVHSAISKAKNHLQTPSQYSQAAGDIYQRIAGRVYTKYQALLKANNALDFDDLLMETCLALRAKPQVLEDLQNRFVHILIDEYQDTNHAQYILAHAMARKNRNLTVVGDPDQSIYAWRGADISNILDFEKDYPDATVVRLERNYRSTKTVLAIASKLISYNRRRKEKALWTENAQGEKAALLLCRDEHDEAEQVTARLKRLNSQGEFPWSSMAIFYRMNSLSRVMEDALRRAGIPYQIARGVEFYNRKEIKDVLAYLRAAVNPHDAVGLERIANVPPRGISDATINYLNAHAALNNTSLWDAMKQADQVSHLAPRAVRSVQSFVQLMESFQTVAAKRGAVQPILEEVYQRSGLEAMLKKLDPTKENEIPNVNELISSAAEYDAEHPDGALSDYLAAVSLVSDADRVEGSGGAVTLMTLHAAKGLEFPIVAIIGLEDGCLPHSRAREDPTGMEEERRLCFVGITRAQERLILSCAAWRSMRGRNEPTINSPFLTEMPLELLDVSDRRDSYYDPDSQDDRRGERDAYRGGYPPRGQGSGRPWQRRY